MLRALRSLVTRVLLCGLPMAIAPFEALAPVGPGSPRLEDEGKFQAFGLGIATHGLFMNMRSADHEGQAYHPARPDVVSLK